MNFLLCLLICVSIATPALSAQRVVRDNLGRPVLVGYEPGEVPVVLRSAARTEFDSEGGLADFPVEAEPDGFVRRDFDIAFSLAATGESNDDAGDENVLAAIAVYGYLSENTALGLRFARPDFAQSGLLELAPQVKMYIFRDPLASWNKFLRFQPFSYSVVVGSDQDFASHGGAWSWKPQLTGGVEFPLGFGAVSTDVGISFAFTEANVDVPDSFDDLYGGVTFVWWWMR